MRKANILVLAMAVVVSAALTGAQEPLTTAFTYQGQLKQGGFPATGLFDFQFELFDGSDPEVASSLGILDLSAVSVSDGIYAVELDFGSVFTGDRSFLPVSR